MAVVGTRRFSTAKLLATGLIGGGKTGGVSIIFTGANGVTVTLAYSSAGAGADRMITWVAKFNAWAAQVICHSRTIITLRSATLEP